MIELLLKKVEKEKEMAKEMCSKHRNSKEKERLSEGE